MSRPASHTVRVQSIDLHYVDWGAPPGADDAPILFLLHGDMRTSRSWDAVARRLCDRYRVLAPDSRGHGDSSWPDTGYTFAQRIDDLESFADAIGMRNAVAVAHSTGGVVATLLSERRPDIFSRLALLEPMVVVTESFQRMVVQEGRDAPPHVEQPRGYVQVSQVASHDWQVAGRSNQGCGGTRIIRTPRRSPRHEVGHRLHELGRARGRLS